MGRLRFRTFSTTADIGLIIYGDDLCQLYRHALMGLNHMLYPRTQRMKSTGQYKNQQIELNGDSDENILNKLMAEILFLVYTKNMICHDIKFHQVRDGCLHANLILGPVSDYPDMEIKSVTYHNLKIRRVRSRLVCKVVFDI